MADHAQRCARAAGQPARQRATSASEPQLAYLRNRLRELGYLEGRNLVFEERFLGGDRQRLPALAREPAAARVEVR